ncbi:MAG: 16S rRNA (cytosine(1402)-N(4))-methyltransferase RsmH [Candidatus Marinimicrobia bacterium]|nr:16S rRNA (cytosine(1402)-N(4))-methyltransferase RsmH [Candidatus Neomarinimicrobiota bacterium]MCF7829617.1 16S rRNA (cytosine(1402)-N(4))-methyltransferase RsmH [Candidatus Neomarinimicrobiota bacterium]MCF7879777.1 16S rRNA (cytosine(1402)-N(4))-methyltransferase RsmH [Candidatus Neomarinimicrobiota bacterium]
MTQIHIPVLCEEVLEWLVTRRDGIYVDATVGAGGHASSLLEQLDDSATLVGIDADAEILDIASNRLRDFPQEILLAETNFSHLGAVLRKQALTPIDGLLMDLGLSSLQIDSPERGFSYMEEGPLDMRFSTSATETAAKFINNADEETIATIIKEYGEERYAKSIARSIITNRPMETTTDLRAAIEAVTPKPYRIKTLARVFQSIRIHVNRELELLQQTLESAVPLLRPGGRIVVIAYHSLEDRIVKQFFRKEESDCVCPPELPICVCDKEQTMRVLTSGVVKPSEEETDKNPRARSARLRAAEKV